MVRKAATILVSFTLALEIALRLYNPLPFRVRGDHIVLPVHQTYTFTHAGAVKLDPVTHATRNSIGFRGPEPPRDWARWFTILTIGGSTTECLFLSDGRTWTDQLARRIAAVRADAWVNNAGLDGQSTFGHLILLKDFVIPLRPRMAIFLIGANDVAVGEARTFDRVLNPADLSVAHRVLTFAADHSQVAAVGENVLRMARSHRANLGDGEIHLTALGPRPFDEVKTAALVAEHRAQYLGPYERRVREIADLCRRNGIEPVFMTQPALNGAGVDPQTGVALDTADVGGTNGRTAWLVQEMYNDVTRRVAADAGVQLIDLAHEIPKDSRYFADWLHYTNEGAVLVGDTVFRHLEARVKAGR